MLWQKKLVLLLILSVLLKARKVYAKSSKLLHELPFRYASTAERLYSHYTYFMYVFL